MNTLEFFKKNIILFEFANLKDTSTKIVGELMSDLSNFQKYEKSEQDKKQSEYEIYQMHQMYFDFLN